ncbi:hypothetical protein ABT126_42795, partial [Streptomyces sp. NPDC002012]
MRPNRHDLGRVFNEVPELYDRVRPGYPDELFAELGAVTSMDERSSVLEVGCGTGQATRSLVACRRLVMVHLTGRLVSGRFLPLCQIGLLL